MKIDTDKALKHRVVCIGGSEESLRRQALRAILAAAGSGDDDYDRETIVADTRKPAEWCGAASMSPFLSDRRIVIVRNLLRVDPKDLANGAKKDAEHPLAKEFGSLPETALLILAVDDEPGDESKMRALESVGKRWASLVAASGGHVISLDADPKRLTELLREECTAKGKKMSISAASLLAEMCGSKLGVAMAELDKLVSYVGEADQIREEDIKAAVTPERDYNVFGLVDAIVAGESGTALRQLRTLFDKNERIESEAFPRIFPQVTRQFRLIWQARLLVDAGVAPGAAPQNVRSMLPSKPNLLDEKDWVLKRAMNSGRRISLPQVRDCLDELVEADAKMKGQRPAFSGIETLELMVLRMCAICSRR